MRTLVLSFALVVAGLAAAAAQDSITVRGSDTLGAELVPRWRDAFLAGGANATFDIAAEGSSAAFSNLINGTAQIGMSSRAIKEEEAAAATAAGVDLHETVVCHDMICVIVNENNPVTDLTIGQVKGIFTGEITDWSEVGGTPGPIAVYTRNTASGTYAAFQELAMDQEEYGADTQKMAGNQEIADEVADNEGGIGYVGLAYSHTEGITAISIGEIAPTAENAATYPIARACYLYTHGAPQGTVKAFIDFCLGEAGAEISREVGFVPESAVAR